jgi:NADP-dependent alcohol dehydrogenase
MNNFTYHNPVRILFGKGQIAELPKLIPPRRKILMTYGGGSIKRNGVHDQVTRALRDRKLVEFGGIEPNPRYETLMKAVQLARRRKIDFLLAVGGGSVLDGTKFIAAAIPFRKGDPWDILARHAPVKKAVPLGSVLTLPATGSEMNSFAVISRASTRQKLPFGSPRVYPQFSILDPETTYTLPERQVINGIVDTWVHVVEQYLTYDVNTPLQARQAEAVWLTLIEEGPKVLQAPRDYGVRANLMWCATQALNGHLNVGAPQDWTTHMIGHELTALYGLDHAQSLAVALPGVLRHQKQPKLARLAQYAERVWGLRAGRPEERAEAGIAKTVEFFRSLGMKTRLSEYGVPPNAPDLVAARLARGGLGEHGNIGSKEVAEILRLCV